MNGEEIIKLTNAVYKVTDLFPAKDPLRMATRKEALNVLFSSILFLKGFNPKNKVKALASLKVLEACFDVAQKQNWVNEKNFEILKREYRKIGEFIKEKKTIKKEVIKKEAVLKEKPVKREQPVIEITNKDIEYEKLSDIQLKLLEILQSKGKLKPNEINAFFPGLSARSVRRELKELREKNIINSFGGGKAIFYSINEYH
ncbi:MAG TPA: hypothetical protein PK476_00875 [Candidatus Pacearchaeota archaeon]|mgnify:CR=1 FL=1|nr:hypothetical protein [Candidatus Pacearchaeota archaeon]HQM24448.1 hypothetical protein [Candidatus Pacearchaeota archaeon]